METPKDTFSETEVERPRDAPRVSSACFTPRNVRVSVYETPALPVISPALTD